MVLLFSFNGGQRPLLKFDGIANAAEPCAFDLDYGELSAALTLEMETYLTDRMVLLLNVRERAMFGSSIGTFHTQVAVGMKFIIN